MWQPILAMLSSKYRPCIYGKCRLYGHGQYLHCSRGGLAVVRSMRACGLKGRSTHFITFHRYTTVSTATQQAQTLPCCRLLSPYRLTANLIEYGTRSCAVRNCRRGS